MNAIFGAFIKEKRQSQQLTLREFCKQHDLDPGNHSKLERGKLDPPDGANKLNALANALNINQDTEEYQTFLDLAAAAKGMLPEDLKDEALLQKLPVLFRTIRNDQKFADTLDKIIEIVRKE